MHFFGGNYVVFLATIVGLGNGSFEMYMAKNHIHVKVDGSSHVHVSEILLQYRYAMGHLVNYLQLPFGKWCCCQLLFIVAECCDVWILFAYWYLWSQRVGKINKLQTSWDGDPTSCTHLGTGSQKSLNNLDLAIAWDKQGFNKTSWGPPLKKENNKR